MKPLNVTIEDEQFQQLEELVDWGCRSPIYRHFTRQLIEIANRTGTTGVALLTAGQFEIRFNHERK